MHNDAVEAHTAEAAAAQSSGGTTAAECVWDADPERLDRAVAAGGCARSRSHANELIAAGNVTLDGVVVTKSGSKVQRGSVIRVAQTHRYVSRGAEKLLAAVTLFSFSLRGEHVLDVGASTGGFTQVALENGASCVQAIDVGHGQLVAELRADSRVRVVEGCNARELDAAKLAALTGVEQRPTRVVADVSFISLTLILPALAQCVAQGAEAVLLIKPQFEVGRVKDGIVTDPKLRERALREVCIAAAAHGFRLSGLELSPITGSHGNIEYLGHFMHSTEVRPLASSWEARIVELSHAAATPQAAPAQLRTAEGRE